MNAGEMVGKMSKNEKDDDKNDSDDENEKAKKGLQGKFALESFRGARVRWYFSNVCLTLYFGFLAWQYFATKKVLDVWVSRIQKYSRKYKFKTSRR